MPLRSMPLKALISLIKTHFVAISNQNDWNVTKREIKLEITGMAKDNILSIGEKKHLIELKIN